MKDLRLLLRLLALLRPAVWRMLLAALLGVLTVASSAGLLATAAYVVSAAAVGTPLFLLTVPVFFVRLFAVSRAFGRYGERLVSHDVTFRLISRLRADFYARLVPLAPARLSEQRSGDLLARVVKDVEELQEVYLRGVAPVLVALCVTLLTAGFFLIFSPALALAAIGFLLAGGVGVPALVRLLSGRLGRRALALRAELDAELVDGVQGCRDLLALNRAPEKADRVAALNRKLAALQRRSSLVAGLQDSLTELLAGLSTVTVLVLATPLVASGEVAGVALAPMALVMLGSFEVVGPLATASRTLDRSLGAAERLFEISDSEPAVADPPEPAPVPPGGLSVELDDVTFAYDGDKPALSGVNLLVPPGGTLAVVGPSGSGKSTLANLLVRFWDPLEGAVRVGGRDVRDYAQDDLRSAVGLVAQETYVFNDTVRGNLSLARPGAGEAELWRALAAARLEEFVRGLPDGLDTVVGEQGARLSGGERQRLAVARTLLKDPPVLVLDEPTAGLDPETEGEVIAAVQEASRGRTVLHITHRLVGLDRADEVVVLDGGRVAERGPHAELAAAGGLYARMLAVQRELLAGSRRVETGEDVPEKWARRT